MSIIRTKTNTKTTEADSSNVTQATHKAHQKKKTRKKSSGKPTLIHENELGHPALRIAGVDEVGRGCLAGPVVAAALILPADIDFRKDPWLKEIRDSKMLPPDVREDLAPRIRAWAASVEIGVASVSEIDAINIFHASHLAMKRAIANLKLVPHHLLIDGKWMPKDLMIPATAIIKGDLKCLSIAAASIVAKVWRDAQMLVLDQTWPGYGFAQNKGYPTPVHKLAIRSLGITSEHRRSFTLEM